jgi:hypothetical protein
MKLARRSSKTKGVILVGGHDCRHNGISKFIPNDQMQLLLS